VVDIFNLLLETPEFQDEDGPAFIHIAKAEEDELAEEDCQWAPKYLLRAILGDGHEETRLIGHVEFLGGRPGALTEAYRLWKSNRWGGLRCVLGLSLLPELSYATCLTVPGDVAQWLLMKSLRFGYLVSCDEVMFFGFVIKDRGLRDEYLFSEPWLHFSRPIKHTDTFDAVQGTISVRQGLFYLFANAMDLVGVRSGVIDEDTWDSLSYAGFTSPGRHWRSRNHASHGSEEDDDETLE
jgi:hypothetical protein